MRRKASEALLSDIGDGEDSSALLNALLLGRRGGIDSETLSVFRRTGLLHFISLSGLHIGIFVGAIWWLGRKAGLVRQHRAVLCLIGLAVFVIVVPARSPTLRAAVICLFFCISLMARRKTDPFNSLSLAAMVLLLIRPVELFSAGFQLSFASVLGILLFEKRINFFLHGIFGFGKVFKRFFAGVVTLLSVGLAAWVGVTPILLYYFYYVDLLSSVWTVAAFPLVAIILLLGVVKMLIAFLLPTVSLFMAIVITGLGDMLIKMVRLFAGFPAGKILTGLVPIGFVLGCYGLVLFTRMAKFRRSWIKKVICFTGLAAIILFLGKID